VDILVSLDAASPLALRAHRNAEESATLRYIPGGTLLGALARVHRVLRPVAADEFADFFLRGQVSMGDAYPATFAQDTLREPAHLAAPLPVTARSCKRWPGFRYQTDEDHPYHGVSDHLMPWLLFALSEETAVAPLDAVKECPFPRCRAAMDVIGGYYRWNREAGAIGRPTETLALRSHTGINRATGTGQDAILYSRQAIAQGSILQAHLRLDDALAETLYPFMEQASAASQWRIGTGRTRGLGLVRLRALDKRVVDAPLGTAEDVAERVNQFNAHLHRQAAAWAIALPQPCYVPITLRADMLLTDGLLRWRARLDEDTLAAHGLAGARLVYHSAQLSRVLGWNGLLGLPRPDALAVARGSVFVFAFDAVPDAAALARLQHDGVGRRREEGFGRVMVADPFHWAVVNA